MPRKRRGRGEGSIYQRADGVWCGSVSDGYDQHGKRRRRTVRGKSKAEVQQKLQDLQRAGIPTDTTRMTVADFLARWLETQVKSSRAATTYLRYEIVVRLHINPYIGSMQLQKLRPMHIVELYDAQQKAGASARQSQLAGIVLQGALKHAVQIQLITANPCTQIAKPQPAKKEMQIWDRDQAAAFLKAAESNRLYAMYVLALTGGLRLGELLALEWGDVDFDGSAVTVRRTLEDVGGHLRAKEPKTPKSRRRVDLPPITMNALHDHRKRMLAEGNAGGPVFCNRKGKYLRRPVVMRHSFWPAVDRAGVPLIRFHDLRHTCATLLLMQGENPKIVSERLGHANIGITLDVYTHALPSMQKAAADKMQQLFG